MTKKPCILMILDGMGVSERNEKNAVNAADMPTYNMLLEKYPNQLGYCSGLDVGLPEGQMGNSEVGHLNMGAGRIVYQDFTRISKSIKDRDFFENPVLLSAIAHCKKNQSDLHLMGLLSDGGVHSHSEHLFALLELCNMQRFSSVYLHIFTDGRDTSYDAAEQYVIELEEYIRTINLGKIATVSGRYYAMDRDKRFDRVLKAYNALVRAVGETAPNALAAIQKSYENMQYDEFILPTVILEENRPVATIKDNDAIIHFNFRPDRARELTNALTKHPFEGFENETFKNLYYVSMTEYEKGNPQVHVAFLPEKLNNTLGAYLSSLGLKQLRLAETEKYPHVTFFFNGGVEEPEIGEDRILVPSPKVATYDLLPEMSAKTVTDHLVQHINEKKYDVIIVNYANPDMVGHTGNFEATVLALEFLDHCIKRVYDAVLQTNAQLFICADHGNAEQMINYETKAMFTAHTSNPVHFMLINKEGYDLKENGKLSDIAPTLLEMMNLQKPVEMTGQSLLIKK